MFRKKYLSYIVNKGRLVESVYTACLKLAERKFIGVQIPYLPPFKKAMEFIKLNCKFCKELFNRPANRVSTLFCSRSCREKYIRKKKNKRTFIYGNYYVIKINENKDKDFFIVNKIKGENRESYLVPRKDCTIYFKGESEDGDGIFDFSYKEDNAIRIRKVPGYKKFFWITECGKFLISNRKFNVLSQTLNHNGYLTHSTKIGGRKGKNIGIRIHRAVGTAFIPNPDLKPEINHNDGDKTNNHYKNLEWSTSSENTQHAIEVGLIKYGPSKGRLFNKDQILEIKDLLSKGASHGEVASLFNVARSTIHRIKHGDIYSEV